MKKKFFAVLLTAALGVSCLAGCGNSTTAETEAAATTAAVAETEAATEAAATTVDPSTIPDEMTSDDGTYQLAFVTDIGQLKDGSFNEGTWNGVKLYAAANGLSYKYYQPANGSDATDIDRQAAMEAAAEAGAELVVCAGYLQATALAAAAANYPDTKFVFVDGWALGLDNVTAVVFQEEQCGYFAGYAAVADGFTKLGFCGGGGGTNAACCRYLYGYIQGANAAAAAAGETVELKYTWQYGDSYSPSTELQTLANGWYENGTEIIFACGGTLCESVFAAASANDGYSIGVDVDQASLSDTVVTSALKELAQSVQNVAGQYYAGEWDTALADQCQTLGAAQGCTGLPTAADSWRFETFTVDEYQTMFNAVVDGSLAIDAEYGDGQYAYSTDYSNLTLVAVQ